MNTRRSVPRNSVLSMPQEHHCQPPIRVCHSLSGAVRTLLFDSGLQSTTASATPDGGESEWFDTVESALADHPVSVGIVFGSRARGEGHEHSDIDIAVAFETLGPGDPE